jgi:hypothetical protein
MRRAWSRVEAFRRARDERGATFVEWAIISLFVFLLIFGLFDFGIAYNASESLRHGVRDAGRVAVVNLVPTNTGCSLTGVSSASSADKSLMCLVKTKAGIDPASTRVWISFPDGTAGIGSHLRICAMFPLKSASGFTAPYFNNARATTEVVLRLEQPFADASATSQQETPSLGTWDFCT